MSSDVLMLVFGNFIHFRFSPHHTPSFAAAIDTLLNKETKKFHRNRGRLFGPHMRVSITYTRIPLPPKTMGFLSCVCLWKALPPLQLWVCRNELKHFNWFYSFLKLILTQIQSGSYKKKMARVISCDPLAKRLLHAGNLRKFNSTRKKT